MVEEQDGESESVGKANECKSERENEKEGEKIKRGLEASNYENVTGFKISFLTSSFQILNFFISSAETDASQISNQTNREIRDRRGSRVV